MPDLQTRLRVVRSLKMRTFVAQTLAAALAWYAGGWAVGLSVLAALIAIESAVISATDTLGYVLECRFDMLDKP